MYVQGRSSARRAVVSATLIMFLLIIHNQAVYVVGNSSSWGFKVGNWTSGKNFKAGDVLIFHYDSSLDNVVAVDVNGYNGCAAPVKAKTYSSGKDRIKLSTGKNYFICSLPPL